MGRPIWSGTIAFGLVNIPVRMYSAVSQSSLKLEMLERKSLSNIRYKRVNENTGKEVAWKDIVKGYKVNGNYVALEDKDFERAAAEKTKRIDILSFVNEEEIDSIYFESGYFIEPSSKEDKPYVLLREALKKTGKVGLGLYVMRNRQHLCVIKIYRNVLLLNKLHFEQEINDTSDYNVPGSVKVNSAELKMAVSLINSMADPFDISKYKDEYTSQLMKFIRAKSKGKLPKASKDKKELPKDVSSLLEQVKASLSKPEAGKKTTPAKTKARRAPAKKRRTPTRRTT